MTFVFDDDENRDSASAYLYNTTNDYRTDMTCAGAGAGVRLERCCCRGELEPGATALFYYLALVWSWILDSSCLSISGSTNVTPSCQFPNKCLILLAHNSQSEEEQALYL